MAGNSIRAVTIDAVALRRERLMLITGLFDLVVIAICFAAAVWANSLMMGADALRAILLLALEAVVYFLLRRIHRGRVHDFDYGAGKLEQFANFAVGSAMALGGLWVGGSALYRWSHPPHQVGPGLWFAAALGIVSVLQNLWNVRAFSRANGSGDSIIMVGQLRTKLAKLVSSVFVLLALGVNALFGDGPVGVTAEVLGSVFMALVMLRLAFSMWRQSMPSLLDRTLNEAQQDLINRALVSRFEEYDDLVAVKSRISGNTPLVEIILGFAAHRRIGEVQKVVDGVAKAVCDLVPDAVVTVIPIEWKDGG